MPDPMPIPSRSSSDASIEAHLAATATDRLEGFKAFLRFPSISTLSEHGPDVRAAAEWLADQLRTTGIEHVEVADTGGHPVVYGDWLHAPGAPTLLIYGHYDVQPVDPLDRWAHPPFEPVVEGERITGRGTADDKGQIHAHVMAVAAVLATRGALPINVRYLFEGEEENSSLHLDAWLEANRARLAADAVVISDTGFFEGNVPAITASLRGMMAAQIDVTLARYDLHSGSHGGAVHNPNVALAQIIAALKGPDGRIRIPGFYDDVVELTAAERAAMAALPFEEAAYRDAVGVPELVGESGYTTMERKTVRPTLDIVGMWGGFQGEGSKTIIPGEAHAKVSTRLVADQDPRRVFEHLERFVLEITPPGVAVTVTYLGGGFPTMTPIDHPVSLAAARALESVFGAWPVFRREGGSIPVAASFASILGRPVVLMGFTQPHDHAHAPNEWFDLRNYEGAIRAIVRLFDEVAGLDLRGVETPGMGADGLSTDG
jgi:acetylornithine deacetylase/succinyl-diaminopimelate desuccinylase-like protein